MWRIALALVVLLAACGKDGGGGSGRTIVEALQGVEVVSRVSQIVVQSDTLLLSDLFLVQGDDEPTLTEYTCTGKRCAKTNPAVPALVEPSILDLATLSLDPLTEYADIIPDYRGAGLSQHDLTVTRQGREWTFANYGAWLRYSALDTVIGTAVVVDTTWQTAYSASFGDATGTNPEGNAQWQGVMLGNTRPQPTHVERQVQALRGDATIGFDFGTNRIDVDFDNIVNLATDAPHPSFGFQDVPITNGVFPDPNRTFVSENAQIAGRFYGPDHAEIGGVFTHPLGMGAFGAKKQ